MGLLRKIADNSARDSLASQLRRKRFALFMRLLESLPRPIKILDVGGTQGFWELMGFTDEPGVEVVVLNVSAMAMGYDNFASVVGDARDMHQFADVAFDVVFSNSVIEHVGTFADQRRMAEEVQRVGKRFFLQTPNLYFPLEPHFLFPFFQFLPIAVRVFLVRHFNLGWFQKIPDKHEAAEHVRSIRLLNKHELMALFPRAALYKERFLGLTKSFVVYDGWTVSSQNRE